MKFSTAKTVSMALLLSGLAIGVGGKFATTEGTSEYTFTLVLVCVLLVAAILVIAIWSKCPKCGKHLIYQVYKLKKCPKCGAPLVEKKPKDAATKVSKPQTKQDKTDGAKKKEAAADGEKREEE